MKKMSCANWSDTSGSRSRMGKIAEKYKRNSLETGGGRAAVERDATRRPTLRHKGNDERRFGEQREREFFFLLPDARVPGGLQSHERTSAQNRNARESFPGPQQTVNVFPRKRKRYILVCRVCGIRSAVQSRYTPYESMRNFPIDRCRSIPSVR